VIVALSTLILIPCYWHRRIEAGDLGSHTYNAWLAGLIAEGRAPGLYIAPQWNNVIVDIALTSLGRAFGFIVAERMVTSVCVLIFFWGAFAFIAASTARSPWFVVPAIAMISYGYIFYSGFLNFYLSLGLAFLSAALFWRGTRADYILGVALAIVTLAAHPMGFGLLVSLVIYIRLAERTNEWYRWLVPASAFLAVLGVHFCVLRFKTAEWRGSHSLLMTGADQLYLFGPRYRLLAGAVLLIGSICFVTAAIQDWRQFSPLPRFRTPFELWTLLVFSAAMLPETIWLPQYAAPFSAIVSRLTSVTAVLGLCVLSSVRPRHWILAVLAACAALFFAFQYQDTSLLNKMEQRTETLVSGLPPWERVTYTLSLGDHNRINSRHLVDRACIGRCFTYSNYEPRTGMFRLRMSPGSPVLSDSQQAGHDMEQGEYVVRAEDLPMAQIYQFDEKDLTKLGIRQLVAGEKNGRLGWRPPSP